MVICILTKEEMLSLQEISWTVYRVLCSERFIKTPTGQCLAIDGGMTLQD